MITPETQLQTPTSTSTTTNHSLARWAPSTGTAEEYPIDKYDPVIFSDKSCCPTPKYELTGVDTSKTTPGRTTSGRKEGDDSSSDEGFDDLRGPLTQEKPNYTKESLSTLPDQWKVECSTSSSLFRLLVTGARPGTQRGNHHQPGGATPPKGQEADLEQDSKNIEENELKRQNVLALLDEVVESSMAKISCTPVQELHGTQATNGTPHFRQSRKIFG